MKLGILVFAAIGLLSTQSFAGERIDGSYNSPERTPGTYAPSVVFSSFYFRVSYGGVGGLDKILQFSPDKTTADHLCQKFMNSKTARSVDMETKQTLFSHTLVSVTDQTNSYGEFIEEAPTGSTYLNRVICTSL